MRKAQPEFVEFPEFVDVAVVNAKGTPVSGVEVATSMVWKESEKNEGDEGASDWSLKNAIRTGPDGVARVKCDDMFFNQLVAREPKTGMIAVASVSGWLLREGRLSMTLQPECRVSVSLSRVGAKQDWISSVRVEQERRPFAAGVARNGQAQLVLPPGDFQIVIDGQDVRKTRFPITVPVDKRELSLGPIDLERFGIALLSGKPAPELKGVIKWVGGEQTLAAHRGEYVILDFWGYWCAPCVRQMPTLMELHDKFKNKGLAILGVHVDLGGEVNTEEKLDERLAKIRESLWGGKRIEFPLALTFGEKKTGPDGGNAAVQYGISHFPTTLLIDRQGAVVGEFALDHLKLAIKQIERLLMQD